MLDSELICIVFHRFYNLVCLLINHKERFSVWWSSIKIRSTSKLFLLMMWIYSLACHMNFNTFLLHTGMEVLPSIQKRLPICCFHSCLFILEFWSALFFISLLFSFLDHFPLFESPKQKFFSSKSSIFTKLKKYKTFLL